MPHHRPQNPGYYTLPHGVVPPQYREGVQYNPHATVRRVQHPHNPIPGEFVQPHHPHHHKQGCIHYKHPQYEPQPHYDPHQPHFDPHQPQFEPNQHHQHCHRGHCLGNEEISRSIEELDQVLDLYDDAASMVPMATGGRESLVRNLSSAYTTQILTKHMPPPPSGPPSNYCRGGVTSQHEDDLPLPPPPPELLQDDARPDYPPTSRFVPPPAVPTRSPDTKLTNASQKPEFESGLPPPDYDDGPESGYITPDQQNSELDYPVNPAFRGQRSPGMIGTPPHTPRGAPPVARPPPIQRQISQTSISSNTSDPHDDVIKPNTRHMYAPTPFTALQGGAATPPHVPQSPEHKGARRPSAGDRRPSLGSTGERRPSAGEQGQGPPVPPPLRDQSFPSVDEVVVKASSSTRRAPDTLRQAPPTPVTSQGDPHALPFPVKLKPISPNQTPIKTPPSPPKKKPPPTLPKGQSDIAPPPPPPPQFTDNCPPPPPMAAPPPPFNAPPPPPGGGPPPPPPMGGAPPPPPPPPPGPTMSPPPVMSGLQAALQGVRLKETNNEPIESGLSQHNGPPDPHQDIISQIKQGTHQLKPSPLGPRIRPQQSQQDTRTFAEQNGNSAPSSSPPPPPETSVHTNGASSPAQHKAPPPPPQKPKNNIGAATAAAAMPSSQNNTEQVYDDVLDIDISRLPGYTRVPDNCPQWRKAMIEKKNVELLENAKQNVIEKRAEEAKWKDVPAWKKNLILEKEKKKCETDAPVQAERVRQQRENDRLQNMPAWKRNLIVSKRGDQ